MTVAVFLSLGQLRKQHCYLPSLSWDEDTHPGRSVCEALSRDIPLRKAHSYPEVPLRTHAHGLRERMCQPRNPDTL